MPCLLERCHGRFEHFSGLLFATVSHLQKNAVSDLCVLDPGRFPQLPADEPVSDQGQASERCLNEGCPVIFSRARVAKQLGSAREALQRLDVKEA